MGFPNSMFVDAGCFGRNGNKQTNWSLTAKVIFFVFVSLYWFLLFAAVLFSRKDSGHQSTIGNL